MARCDKDLSIKSNNDQGKQRTEITMSLPVQMSLNHVFFVATKTRINFCFGMYGRGKSHELACGYLLNVQ